MILMNWMSGEQLFSSADIVFEDELQRVKLGE